MWIWNNPLFAYLLSTASEIGSIKVIVGINKNEIAFYRDIAVCLQFEDPEFEQGFRGMDASVHSFEITIHVCAMCRSNLGPSRSIDNQQQPRTPDVPGFVFGIFLYGGALPG